MVYALALFAAGAVTGAMVMRPKVEPSPLKLNRSGEIAAKLRDRLNTRLHLTPEQSAKIGPIIVKTSNELEASHRDCLNRIMDILNQMHAQVSPDLTPEQKEALKLIEAERRETFLKKYEYSPDDQKPAKGPN
jgi:dsDNA-binding SOS-regulon protein